MDATHKDMGPITNNHTEMAIFYIVYFVVFPFFFINVFVAMIIVTFQQEGEDELLDHDLDKNEVQQIEVNVS